MRRITKSFGSQRALDEVDLTVRAGEIHGLLGENGAGKSTLMNVLSGMLRPDAGQIIVSGQQLRLGNPRASSALGIGMVHQHFSLVPALSVAENLSLAAERGAALFRRSDDLAQPARALAERLGWHFDPGTPVWQLPIGRQQRLEILKVLQQDARWLLFDEPTAILSPPEAEELFTVLERLRSDGRGMVFISHKLPEVLRLCDRITVLRGGRRVGELPRGAGATELARLMVGETGDQALGRWGVGAYRRSGGENTERVNEPESVLNIHAPEHLNAPTPDRPNAPTPDRPNAPTPQRPNAPTPQRPNAPTPQRLIAESPALVIRNLRVRDRRGLEAVRGLSLEVGHGEIFGIAGVDGNGQTELAEAVVGLRPVLSGSLQLSSEPVSSQSNSHPHRPGYIPEDRHGSGLVLPLSVRENLALEIYNSPRFRWGPFMRLPLLWSATHAMAQRFDVRVNSELQPAGTLSGGNQQKIVVARALSGERSLLVVVNPTRGLDIAATEYVHQQLRAARSDGVGVLLISTDLDEVLALSDRIGVLFEGALQGIVSPQAPRERIGQMMGGGSEAQA